MINSTYKTFLMIKKSGESNYSKLVDIKDFPDLGGEPEMLETTTLSDGVQTYIPGIQSLESLTFSCNYDKTNYNEIKTLAGTEHNLAVWFGGTENAGVVTPTGDEGKFEFKGQVSVFVSGGGVNEVRGMTVSVVPSTPITLASE